MSSVALDTCRKVSARWSFLSSCCWLSVKNYATDKTVCFILLSMKVGERGVADSGRRGSLIPQTCLCTLPKYLDHLLVPEMYPPSFRCIEGSVVGSHLFRVATYPGMPNAFKKKLQCLVGCFFHPFIGRAQGACASTLMSSKEALGKGYYSHDRVSGFWLLGLDGFGFVLGLITTTCCFQWQVLSRWGWDFHCSTRRTQTPVDVECYWRKVTL